MPLAMPLVKLPSGADKKSSSGSLSLSSSSSADACDPDMHIFYGGNLD